MENLLRDPVNYVLGFLTLIVGYLALRARPRREVSYELLSTTPLLTARQEDEKRLRVTFEGEPVRDVSIVLFQIFNTVATGPSPKLSSQTLLRSGFAVRVAS